MQVDGDLDGFVPRALGRHRDDFSPEKFEPLVRIEDAGLDHPLQVGDGEGAAVEAFGGTGEGNGHAGKVTRRECFC